MARVLFVCLHNAGRSQMSEALFARAANGRHESASAGTTPGERLRTPGKRYLDWDLEDPKGKSVDEVRRTRDEIGRRVEQLVGELDAQPT
ncbi:MAG: hypothetical protein QOI19_496 [Thermoleophilaceae bacterium]|jgi:arsenate reductase|nr:hypothetical protein [Thermoleophilaceae bacterium]